MIYVFGNSHSHFFTDSDPATFGFGNNEHPVFKSYSLGPTLAYNFLEHHYHRILQVLSEINFDKNNDYIILAVGEVDCRWHLPLQISKSKRKTEDVVEECLDRFFRVYTDLKERGYKCIVWASHPSTTSGHDDNPSSPVFGECVQRNTITKYWAKYLKELSEKENIPFISIVDELIDENNLTKMEYFLDYCHLDSKKLLKEVEKKFKKNKLWT